MRPCAPARRPSPPVTSHMTAPRWISGSGLGPRVPRPTVLKETLPASPYLMLPDSTNIPSPTISTSDSKLADPPLADSTPACTPSAFSTLRWIWLAAEVLARSFLSEPGTGAALPLNSRAKTSSFIVVLLRLGRFRKEARGTCWESTAPPQGSQRSLALTSHRPRCTYAKNLVPHSPI